VIRTDATFVTPTIGYKTIKELLRNFTLLSDRT
jgi:hypothetical protein